MDTPDPNQDATRAYELNREQLRVFFRGVARQKHTAEDMLQEVYVQLARNPPVEKLRDPVAYLFRVAWNVLKRTQRNANRQPVACDPAVLESLITHHGADVVDEVIAEDELLTCLEELPPLYGAVFYLRRRDGLDYPAIGRRLSISTPQVRRYLGKALAHLKTHRDRKAGREAT